MKTIVLTSDKTLWSVQPLIHQWHKYAGHQPLEVYGYTDPGVTFMQGHKFHSIGKFEDYPVKRWSNGVIRALQSLVDDELVNVMMDDYWLVRDFDPAIMNIAEDYMDANPGVVRFDLTTDRLGDKHFDVCSIRHYDIIMGKREATYNFSMQASIWRIENMLKLLVPDEDPWEAELRGNARLAQMNYQVVGTRQWPLKYIIAVNKGVLMLDGGWCVPPRKLSKPDIEEIYDLGMIPEGVVQA